jgi:NAD(P)-dependent dehydrogenase (short-subunit alcohol dehydrogenase family)
MGYINWAANKLLIVNNAGIAPMTPSLEVTPEEISSVFRTNFQGPFLLVQAALPYIARGGRIINISTCLSRMGLGSPVYCASKAAIDSLTYNWAGEVHPHDSDVFYAQKLIQVFLYSLVKSTASRLIQSRLV